MADRTKGPLKALLVLGWNKKLWVKETNLPFAPFPGLGIRVDTYDLVQVDSVVVGDYDYDVTCLCTFEDEQDGEYSAARLRQLGFKRGDYP